MKKTIWIIWLVALVFLMGTVSAFAAGNEIGEEQAKTAALQEAGVSAEDVDRITVETDRDDGVRVYEIEFRADGVRYEYTVDAQSGEIVHWEIERKPGTDGAPVDLEEARAAALESAGRSEDEVVFSKAKQKKDDGRQVFEIEFFVVDEAEYEYQIDLESGTILEESYERWDEESARAYNKLSQNNEKTERNVEAEGLIDLEEAKAIALEQAGLKADEVTFKKAKLERDDGRLEYEIEFFVAGEKEYEYEIDANTGEVLHVEIENRG